MSSISSNRSSFNRHYKIMGLSYKEKVQQITRSLTVAYDTINTLKAHAIELEAEIAAAKKREDDLRNRVSAFINACDRQLPRVIEFENPSNKSLESRLITVASGIGAIVTRLEEVETGEDVLHSMIDAAHVEAVNVIRTVE